MGWMRSMRRLHARPQSTPRWILEKTWLLNASRSKQITVGLCLDRKLNVCVAIESPTGLGLKGTQSELEHALSPLFRDVVLKHLNTPGGGNTASFTGEVQYQCILTRCGEPGLRIAKGDAFVILGKATCKALYYLAPVILQRLAFLKETYDVCGPWVATAFDRVLAEAKELGQDLVYKEKAVLDVLTSLSQKVGNKSLWPPVVNVEVEMYFDLLFRHKDLFARMYIDYRTDDDQDDDESPFEDDSMNSFRSYG